VPMSYSRSFADPEAARRAGAGPLEQACAVVVAREWGMGRRDGTLAAGPLAVRSWRHGIPRNLGGREDARVHVRGWGANLAFDLRWRPHGTFVMSLLKPRGAGEVADFDRSCERKKAPALSDSASHRPQRAGAPTHVESEEPLKPVCACRRVPHAPRLRVDEPTPKCKVSDRMQRADYTPTQHASSAFVCLFTRLHCPVGGSPA
jgi:hypothetical protein